MKIVFNANNQYVIKSRAYDHVTHVIEATVGRAELEAWRKRVGPLEAERITREAADWGTAVHEITALSDKGKWRKVDALLSKNPDLLPPLLAWREWCADVVLKWVMIEEVLYIPRLLIAGTVDRIGYIQGDNFPSIVDIKTGGLWESAGIQVWGAYRELYNERRKVSSPAVGRGIIVQLPRRDPGVAKIKDVTKSVYVDKWELAKKDYFNSMGRVLL